MGVRILDKPVLDSEQRGHCVARIAAIVAQKQGDRRSILQLGYNLGRLSELTGLGREAFWDRWKTPVAEWNLAELERLVQELRTAIVHDDQSSDGAEGNGK
jgi:hypothetical protein